jgi:hypothetical protein
MRQPGHFGQRGLPTTISAALLSSYQESDLPPTLCQSNPFSLPGVAGRPCPFGQHLDTLLAEIVRISL